MASAKFHLRFVCQSCFGEFRKRVKKPRLLYREDRASKRKCPLCGARDVQEKQDARGMRHLEITRGNRKTTRRRNRRAKRPDRWRAKYDAYLGSADWAFVRACVFERDRHCMVCGTTKELHCHHLHYNTLGKELGDELITLCRRCHVKEHASGPLRERRKLWHPKPIWGDAETRQGPDWKKMRHSWGDTVIHRSGSAKSEAAETAGSVGARNLPTDLGAHATT